jgi:urocanate hydratase
MDILVYTDGLGGMIGYKGLSAFIRDGKMVELDVSEKTLRRDLKLHGRYSVGNVPNRELRVVEFVEVQRKKVRPKYLFGKEY